MLWVDYGILGIIVISALMSIGRGFIREILSLAAWAIAFWVAMNFSSLVDPFFTAVTVPSMRKLLAFLTVFVAVLLLAALVNSFLGKLITATGLSGTDRALGIIFGAVRGAGIVSILVLLAGFTPLPKDPWWQQSMFLKYFQAAAIWIRQYLPDSIASMITF
jgi:membrane protein required for colicin V production